MILKLMYKKKYKLSSCTESKAIAGVHDEYIIKCDRFYKGLEEKALKQSYVDSKGGNEIN